ncbi:MAG: pyridoxal phosphate enzyme (YggS family) [Flavobacteriales bacterium]|jgi:pyridoxal phosphate enzyme (YggS family)
MSESIIESLNKIKSSIPNTVELVAVSKTKPASDIEIAYGAGQRIFGENKAQELANKYELLPKDIEWHMIGHLQRNKVKYIAPFVSLIHGVESERLLKEINKNGAKFERKIPVLLQIHIAQESNKFGLTAEELVAILENAVSYKNIEFKGLMGMATFTDDQDQIALEFEFLNDLFQAQKKAFPELTDFNQLSMGMSGDFELAIEKGSTMIRVGSSIFGSRN